jgi:ribonuclease HI
MAAYHVLNTDASKLNPSDPSSEASIGVVLRQRIRKNGSLVVVDYISEIVGSRFVQEAEYLAIIEGLKLARRYEPTDLYVYVDSSTVARQFNAPAPRIKEDYMAPLHMEARNLIDEFGVRIKAISWVPREMNAEADQRAADAFVRRAANHS